MSYDQRTAFAELLGKTIVSIAGMNAGSDQITFECSDGSEYVMLHNQDCCESVSVEDVAGNADDLIGSPITQAEEASSSSEDDLAPPGYKPPEYRDSWTWTFYKLATVKGYVTLRWLGESNGYYGESADFERRRGPSVTPAGRPAPNGGSNG